MKMPAIFVGHGSPMLALEKNEQTRKFNEIGNKIIEEFGKPKAILVISAHWYTKGNFTNDEEEPKQIYDMYGFPEELYEVKYPVCGYPALAKELESKLDLNIRINNEWGIDHGTWTVLIHMFKNADIPVVQLSVNENSSEKEVFHLGEKLSFLREGGYLVIGSGNVVHNLRMTQWGNEKGTFESDEFDEYIKNAVVNKEYTKVINHRENEFSKYAVPTLDHYMPLLYILGISQGEDAYVFNNIRTLGSISMTSFAFGMKK